MENILSKIDIKNKKLHIFQFENFYDESSDMNTTKTYILNWEHLKNYDFKKNILIDEQNSFYTNFFIDILSIIRLFLESPENTPNPSPDKTLLLTGIEVKAIKKTNNLSIKNITIFNCIQHYFNIKIWKELCKHNNEYPNNKKTYYYCMLGWLQNIDSNKENGISIPANLIMDIVEYIQNDDIFNTNYNILIDESKKKILATI